jgi:hypothetical protein
MFASTGKVIQNLDEETQGVASPFMARLAAIRDWATKNRKGLRKSIRKGKVLHMVFPRKVPVYTTLAQVVQR